MKTIHENNSPVGQHAVKTALAILFVAFLSANVFAQTTQGIRGTVKYFDDLQPVSGANIYLKSLSSIGTFSDAQGEFTFPRPVKSGDVLVFSFLGLKTIEYTVPEQPVAFIEITMEVDPIQMVDEILVEGNKNTTVAVPLKKVRKGKVDN
ncbi:MAG: carboxypeptidase-like regulatory domain-containing protein [Cyclobacteriaceae bacterium]|nr:carboxypeptidase-like regulatory domain-containing protein [Cyclobacteriaceae bacterium]